MIDKPATISELQNYVAMLRNGIATVEDFDDLGIDLMAIANRFGLRNCWTGTSGGVAAELHRIVTEFRSKQ